MAYADDVVTAAVLPPQVTPEGVFAACQQVSSIVVATFRRRALVVNTGAGTTEIVVAPAGKGARAIQRMALASDHSKVVVDATCTISIVDAYKHLGDWFTADGRMSMTINIRCSRFRAANAPPQAHCLQPPSLERQG